MKRFLLLASILFIFQHCENEEDPSLAEVTTAAITDITHITASGGGEVLSDGGAEVSARGICWSTEEEPTIEDSKTEDGTGTGEFISLLTNLTGGTVYYVRAYATNKAGTAYGDQVQFTTSPTPTLAAVSTTLVSNITPTTASSGGTITSDGNDPVTARGVCWATTTEPTIDDFKTTDGTGTGVFISDVSALSPGSTYYVRAYATNSVGTAYGDEVQFTTSPTPTIAVLSTVLVNTITATTASSGGTITSDGNTPVTARGICWATATEPTIDDFKTTDGIGTGEFLSDLTDLAPGSTYYVRAYATNSVGTAYGNEVSFSTNSLVTAFFVTKDATIFNNQAANSANGNYGAGGSELLQVGYASPTGIYARALMQFDLSSLPANAVIESVSLELTLGSSGTFVPEISVFKMNQTWTEGTTAFCTFSAACNTQGVAIAPGGTDVTWNEISYSGTGTNPWTTIGGTFATLASATSVDAGASTILYNSAGLKNDVQGWVSNSATNFGWILKTEFITNTSAMRRFRSREGAAASGNASTAPKLVITYH